MYSVVEMTKTGLHKVADIIPPPGQRLKCDSCDSWLESGRTIYLLKVYDSNGKTEDKYVCRPCSGTDSGAV